MRGKIINMHLNLKVGFNWYKFVFRWQNHIHRNVLLQERSASRVLPEIWQQWASGRYTFNLKSNTNAKLANCASRCAVDFKIFKSRLSTTVPDF